MRSAHPRQLAAWSMRAALVLVYWADRLDAVACATRADVLAGLQVLLGSRSRLAAVELPQAPGAADVISGWREEHAEALCRLWNELRRLSRRRPSDALAALALACADLPLDGAPKEWQLVLGSASVPEPAMLIRRILNGQDPERLPALARKRLRRRPLCLLGGAS
jgi:hypothetical protein